MAFRTTRSFCTSAFLLMTACSSVLALTEPKRNCSVTSDPQYTGLLADCSDTNQTSVPSGLPDNTTSLDLSRNDISVLGRYALNQTNLKCLNLSFNSIRSMENETFLGSPHLRELYLNNNHLSRASFYPQLIFSPLRYLKKLHLHNNNLGQEYPNEAIGKLQSVGELTIDTFSETKFPPGFSHLRNLKRLLLGFRECKMSWISNDTFEVFEGINVKVLDLQYCPIGTLEKNAFWYLHALEILILSNAIPLSPTTAISALYGLRDRSMKSIKINHIYQQMISRVGLVDDVILRNDVLKHLGNVCVETFDMINVKLTWLAGEFFSGNSKFLSCIKYLNLSNHRLLGDVKIMFELPYAPNLVALNLQRNHEVLNINGGMKEMCKPSSMHIDITLPASLEYWNLQGISDNIGCVYNVTISNAKSLKHFDLSYCGIEFFNDNFNGIETLSYLDISGNNLAGTKGSFLTSTPLLETFIMVNVVIEDHALLSPTSNILTPAHHLVHVDFSMNDLVDVDPKIFASNPVRRIILSRNRFKTIPFDLTTTPLLHYLDLSFNSLTVLSETEMKIMEYLAEKRHMTLKLDGNLLSCGCQNLHFVRWLYITHVEVSFDRNCLADNGTIVNMTNVHEDNERIWRQCYGKFLFSVISSVFAFAAMVMMGTYVVYRKKTFLFNVMLRLFFKNPSQVLSRNNFLNDAYIVYSDADYRYICHTVEERQGLKLFIRDRDTTPGKLISHEIIRGIDSSWRCIVFLSQELLEDNWCYFSIEYLVYVSSQRPSIQAVLVLCDDVVEGDISPSLLNVVEEQNIYRMREYCRDDRLWNGVGNCIKEKNSCNIL